MRLKENYTWAKCCKPQVDDKIVGYYSYNNIVKVHKEGCGQLDSAEKSRLINLKWQDILAEEEFTPKNDYNDLNEFDFKILRHHLEYGVDYSRKIAAMYKYSYLDVFECHKKLRDMKLLKRVEPTMIRYRKGVVDNKWIKHRNHTYYDLTDKGKAYLDYSTKNK